MTGAWSTLVSRVAVAALALGGGAAAAQRAAQDEQTTPARREVEARVTAIQAEVVYLDVGQDDGLAVGDLVRLQPLGGSSLDARIVGLARTSARARVESGQAAGAEALAVGDEARVLIPTERAQAGREEGAADAAPEHPPWSHPPVEWREDVPLLAPIEALEPEERARELHGRAYLSFDATRDRASVESDYGALRGGLDAELENPFGHAGTLQLDVVGSRRTVDVEDDGSETDSLARIERLSYRVGGLRGQPTRFELGRFLPAEFPELGLLDGVEVVRRLAGGSRIGTSVGYLPVYDDELETGDDLAVAVFGRWVDGEEERLALGGALQKTWHEGEPDRDLVLGQLDWAPTDSLTLRSSAWVDLFTSDDELEEDDLALTRLNVDASWRPAPRSGLALFLNRFERPQLLRDEYEPVADEGVREYESTRVGLRGWTPLSDALRLTARVDRWNDEVDSGTGGELSLSARDLLWDRGSVSASLRAREGRFTDVTGLRLRASRGLGRGSLAVRYDAALYERASELGDVDDALQHSAGLTWDWSFAGGWDLSVYGETRFGDDQDAQTLGLFLQRRF